MTHPRLTRRPLGGLGAAAAPAAAGAGVDPPRRLSEEPTLPVLRGFLAHAAAMGGKGAGRVKGNAHGALWTAMRAAVKARPKGAKCFSEPEVRAQCLMVYV